MTTTFNWALPTTTPQNGKSWSLIQQVPLASPRTHIDFSSNLCLCIFLIYMSYGFSGVLASSLFTSGYHLREQPFTESPDSCASTKYHLPPPYNTSSPVYFYSMEDNQGPTRATWPSSTAVTTTCFEPPYYDWPPLPPLLGTNVQIGREWCVETPLGSVRIVFHYLIHNLVGL